MAPLAAVSGREANASGAASTHCIVQCCRRYQGAILGALLGAIKVPLGVTDPHVLLPKPSTSRPNAMTGCH